MTGVALAADSEELVNAKQKLTAAISNLGELAAVEEIIRSKLSSDASLLEEIPQYLLELGGKRMRPVLTLLAARALGIEKAPTALLEVAAGIELIHMATLLHDDIIDNADMRRHKASPLVKFGAAETLLAGDFLLVRAFSLCARLDREIIDATERACVHLTEGEILEVPLYKQAHTRQSSLEIADKKTAALFELAAYSAAHITTGKPAVAEAFARFGQALGIAFQILDDILDVTSDADLLGKPSGTDIRERKPAMVNIIWLESGAPLARRLLEAPKEDSASEQAFIDQAVAELRSSNVIQEARALAISYTDVARSSLQEGLALADSYNEEAAAALESIIEYTVERVL